MRGSAMALCLVLPLAGCVAMPGAQAPQGAVPMRIMTETEFRQAVVGRRLMLREAGFLLILPDGTLRANAGQGPISGTWRWERGAWCGVIAPPGRAEIEDCQHWETLGSGFRVTRRRGAGPSYYLPVG